MAGQTLKTRTLGKSGIAVTKIGIGLWAIGGDEWGPTDDQESLRTIDAALDAGVTFFDTADVYGGGHSEKLLGQAARQNWNRLKPSAYPYPASLPASWVCLRIRSASFSMLRPTWLACFASADMRVSIHSEISSQ